MLKEKLVDEWPVLVKELAGAWNDFPSLEEISDNSQSDFPREEL